MVRVEFCDRLVEVRRERGLTQVQLAERVGVHPSQLHRYEAGTAQPTLDVIRRLAVALSVSADVLVFGDEPRTQTAERLRRALESATFLDKRRQAVVAELIEAFVAADTEARRPKGPRGPKPKKR